MLAVILPSRGLIHSRTIETLIKTIDRYAYDFKLYVSHDNPIPECFNIPIELALKDNPEAFIIVEEDIALNFDTLNAMIQSWVFDKTDIAAADYLVAPGVKAFKTTKGILTGGLGCVLIKASVMKDLLPFSDQTSYDMDMNPFPSLPNGYGHQDIDFYVRAFMKNYKVKVCGEVEHLRVIEMGKAGTNNGVHKIEAIA